MYRKIILNTRNVTAGRGYKFSIEMISAEATKELGRHNKPAVLILPGGGYEYVSDREAEPVALRFAGMGFAAFILRYPVREKAYPYALIETASAIEHLRKNAAKYDIDPKKIVLMGFSAGGHLAASVGTLWKRISFGNSSLDRRKIRPDALILSYPVITSGDKAHLESFDNLCGNDEKLRETFSLEDQVTKSTPPVFIWHCADDDCVPVENSLKFITALSEKGIMYEAHIFPKGGHGLSLADESTAKNSGQVVREVQQWTDLAADFIKRL